MTNEEQVALNIFKRLLTNKWVYVDETFSSGYPSSLLIDGNVSYDSVEEQETFIKWLDKIRGEKEDDK